MSKKIITNQNSLTKLVAQNTDKVKTHYTFSLAIIIISAYIVFFGYVMFQNKTPGYDELKTITATFGVIVAAVVGYYFGQRPLEAAEQRAQVAAGQKAESDTKLGTETKRDVIRIDSDIAKRRQQKGEHTMMLELVTQLLKKYGIQ
jgi:hypothetical protein